MGFMDKLKNVTGVGAYDDNYEDDYYDNFDDYEGGMMDDQMMGQPSGMTQSNIGNMGSAGTIGGMGGISLSGAGTALEMKVVKPQQFDSVSQIAGLPYPGGAPIDKLAQQSQGGVYKLPHSNVDGAPLDMSFSGLKTAVVNLAHHAQQVGEELDRAALARDFAQAVSDTLVPRAMEALKQTGYQTLVAAGGVAANSIIRGDLERECAKLGAKLYLPPLKLCGDNGAMIGAQGYYEYLAGHTAQMDLNAYATRDISE